MALENVKRTSGPHVMGTLKCQILSFDMGAVAYVTNGVPINYARFGINQPLASRFSEKNGYIFNYDGVNKKIKVFTTANTEVGNGVDLSALTGVTVVVFYQR